MAERPPEPGPDVAFAHDNGWDAEFETFDDFDLPTYVGPATFMNLPWVTDPAELRLQAVDVAIVGAGFAGLGLGIRLAQEQRLVAVR